MNDSKNYLRINGRVDYAERMPFPEVIRQLTVTIDFQPNADANIDSHAAEQDIDEPLHFCKCSFQM